MKAFSSMHVHTTYCDGKNTPVELAEEALTKGLKALGFSGHSTIDFAYTSGMSVDGTLAYIKEVNNLKKQYEGRLEIALGIEQDYFSEIDRSFYDYVIGSVHSVVAPRTGRQYVVDMSLEQLQDCIKDDFDGDSVAMACYYYEAYQKMITKIKPTVAGHLDLLTKLNKDHILFDEENKRYQKAALDVARYAIESGALVEINTGGMFRGYTQKPYPAPFILKELSAWKARVIISSDCHKKEALDYRFDEMLELIRHCGFTSYYEWSNGEFVEVSL